MAGFVFTMIILSILAASGFVFAWVIRLASHPVEQPKNPNPILPTDPSPTKP